MTDSTQGQNKVESGLEAANAILTQLVPLVGVTMTGVRLIVSLIKSQHGDVGPFADEIAKFETAADQLQQSVNDYNARFRSGQ